MILAVILQEALASHLAKRPASPLVVVVVVALERATRRFLEQSTATTPSGGA
jgi:hypothetical protein